MNITNITNVSEDQAGTLSEGFTEESIGGQAVSPSKGMAVGNMVTGTVAVVKDVMVLAAENEDSREAARNLARAAKTITATINNIVLPVAAVNAGVERAREYFRERFERDIENKMSVVPPEEVIEPNARIAGQIMQGLAAAHEETPIREAFLNLLKSSMDKRVAAEVHPAYAEIIKQLTTEEAELLHPLLAKGHDVIPIAELQYKNPGNSSHVVCYRNLLPILDVDNGGRQNPIVNKRMPEFVDNWSRLGIIETSYTKWLSNERQYEWVKQRPEYLLRGEDVPEHMELTFQRGMLTLTAFGRRFAALVT